jgi:hypothetical protein
VVVALGCPDNESPLSYERLSGEWAQWYRTAQRFEYKVPAPDRGDIRHSIMLELARARARDRDKTISEATQCRIAACVVADYWRTQYKFTNGLDCGSCSQKQRAKCKEDYLYSQCPKAFKIESLSKPITDANGNVTEIGETIVNDQAIDLDAWVDARTFLLGFPRRLIEIAYKKLSDEPLTNKEHQYLWYWRQREQKGLIAS